MSNNASQVLASGCQFAGLDSRGLRAIQLELLAEIIASLDETRDLSLPALLERATQFSGLDTRGLKAVQLQCAAECNLDVNPTQDFSLGEVLERANDNGFGDLTRPMLGWAIAYQTVEVHDYYLGDAPEPPVDLAVTMEEVV